MFFFFEKRFKVMNAGFVLLQIMINNLQWTENT